MTPIKFIHGVNTSEDQVRANVEWALAQGHQDLLDRRCIILGGGPSLEGAGVHALVAHMDRKTVFALNGAWRIPHSYGVDVDHIVMMDARTENTEFVGDVPGATWLVASQCHKDVFSELKDFGCRVKIWHVAGSPVVEEKGLHGIPGGGTVLTHAIHIAQDMGFKHIVLAGVDSSHADGRHHAYEQQMNDDDTVIEVSTPAGTTFTTTPELAAQADYVMNQIVNGERRGFTFEIIGDGLLPTLFREHNELRADPDRWEPEKYRRMWSKGEYRLKSPAMDKIDEIRKHVGSTLNRVLDFGCGTGRAAAFLEQNGATVVGIDFTENCLETNIPFLKANLWSLPDYLKGDVGICVDVMEHIPPGKVDDVLRNIARTVPKCIFSISYQPDRMGALIGEKLHLSVHPESWWIKKLGEHFASVTTDNGLIICEVD